MSCWDCVKVQVSGQFNTCAFYSHHFHLKHITGFWQKLRKRLRPTSQMFSDVCSLNCVRSEGLNQVQLCDGLGKFPLSLMGNSVTCLAPKQETKPMQTDGAKRHMACLPLTLNRPSTTVLIGQSADERHIKHFTVRFHQIRPDIKRPVSVWSKRVKTKQTAMKRPSPSNSPFPSQREHVPSWPPWGTKGSSPGDKNNITLCGVTVAFVVLQFLNAAFHVYTKTGGACPSGD